MKKQCTARCSQRVAPRICGRCVAPRIYGRCPVNEVVNSRLIRGQMCVRFRWATRCEQRAVHCLSMRTHIYNIRARVKTAAKVRQIYECAKARPGVGLPGSPCCQKTSLLVLIFVMCRLKKWGLAGAFIYFFINLQRPYPHL